MRIIQACALALLVALPAGAAAERLVVAEASALDEAIERATIEKVRDLFERALAETGVEILPTTKGRTPEIVASLTLDRVDGALVITAQVSRWKLDRWSARSEVRVGDSSDEALEAASGELARQIALAIQTAPPRDETRPDERPPVRKLGDARGPTPAEPAEP